ALGPWAVQPADALARGADITLLDPHTVAVVPHEPRKPKVDTKPAKSLRLHLVFAEDGGIAERRVVELADGKTKVLYREVCDADGTVRALDGDGKELAVRKGKLAPAAPPAPTPDPTDL